MYPHNLRDSIYLALEENENKRFLGYVLARRINYINSNAEVGTILLKKGRGKGYFKEISVLFYTYLFDELNLHKVYTSIIASNEISIEAHKKIGFVVDGKRKEQVWQDGKYKDVYLISLFAEEFRNKNKLRDYLLPEFLA